MKKCKTIKFQCFFLIDWPVLVHLCTQNITKSNESASAARIPHSRYLFDSDVVSLWRRKCKLATTGPWQEIPPITLSDVTILPCAAQSSVDVVSLWAISNKGDVLCRLGVTTLTPAVRSTCCKHTHTHTFEQNSCVISHYGVKEALCFRIDKDYIKYATQTLLCYYVFCLRDHHGSMLGLTNPSSPSPSEPPARCGASPGTVLPFTEAPSLPRALQVRRILSSYFTESKRS